MTIQHLSRHDDSYPGEAVNRADAVSSVLDDIRRLTHISAGLTDTELTATAQVLALVMQHTEAALVALTADAIDRGAVHRSTAANAAQWVQRLSAGEPLVTLIGAETASIAGPLTPLAESSATESDAEPANDQPVMGGIEPAHAFRIARLATACRDIDNAPLAEAIFAGTVNTSIANTALNNVDKVADVLPDASREEIFGWYLALPPGSSARHVRELTKRLIDRFSRPEQEVLDGAEDKMQRHETLSWNDEPDGMVRLVAHLSADHAETVRHAIESLAAPAPVSDCCDNPHHRHDPDAPKTGEPDLRTAGKRRADALLQLITMGAGAVDADGSIRTFGTARLVVTIDYDALAKAIRGLGITDNGAAITPDTVRQLACDAEIIPMVLGSRNEPLNVGRKKRLVDKELRRAVIQRDRHCTYQGCDRPPVMCEVHHVVPWWAGGETSLLNSALLCGRHHRVVHRDDLHATVTQELVTWNAA